MKDSCLDHQCSEGWVSKIDADTKEGNSDDECCDRTCALYTCPEEFALNGENKDVIADRDTCCLPLCKHYKCDGDYGDYEADPRQQDQTYNPDKNEARRRCCRKVHHSHGITNELKKVVNSKDYPSKRIDWQSSKGEISTQDRPSRGNNKGGPQRWR